MPRTRLQERQVPPLRNLVDQGEELLKEEQQQPYTQGHSQKVEQKVEQKAKEIAKALSKIPATNRFHPYWHENSTLKKYEQALQRHEGNFKDRTSSVFSSTSRQQIENDVSRFFRDKLDAQQGFRNHDLQDNEYYKTFSQGVQEILRNYQSAFEKYERAYKKNEQKFMKIFEDFETKVSSGNITQYDVSLLTYKSRLDQENNHIQSKSNLSEYSRFFASVASETINFNMNSTRGADGNNAFESKLLRLQNHMKDLESHMSTRLDVLKTYKEHLVPLRVQLTKPAEE
jgi:hypothetical protein